MHPIEKKTVQLSGETISYAVSGTGPPVLFLHGLGGGSMSWEHQLHGLADRFTVLAWDTPGYGGSTLRDPHVDGYADAAAQLIRALGTTPVAIVGHSMGGVIGARLASRHQDLVSMVVLSSTFSGSGKPPGAPLSDGYQKRIDELHTLDRQEFGAARARAMAAKNTAPEILANVARVAASIHTQGFIDACTMLDRADNSEILPALQVPVLILEGAGDPIVPRTQGDRLQMLVRHAERAVLPRVGHASYMESPGQFNEVVATFLKKHTPVK